MKVIVLHPPMYPVNHKFYNLLAKKVDLIVYQFGEHPVHHTNWTSENIRQGEISYKLKIFGQGSVSTFKLLNPHFLIAIYKEKPDIVLSIAFWLPSLYVSLLKTMIGFKLIILTNMIASTETKVSSIKQKIRSLIASQTDCFISASQLTTDYLQKKFPQNKIHLSVQTIDVNEWINKFDTIQAKDLLRNKYGIQKDTIIMLGIGNFIEKKNWIPVINIMSNIDNLLFLLIGSGEKEETYKSIVKKLNIGEKVSIVGRKEGSELLEYFKMSDFLIFPSLYDQFGFVVPEALSSGLPVICTKTAGASTLIESGVNGYLINPTEELTDVIKNTINNLLKMQQNVKTTMLQFTLESRVNEFVDIFENCLKEKNNAEL